MWSRQHCENCLIAVLLFIETGAKVDKIKSRVAGKGKNCSKYLLVFLVFVLLYDMYQEN